MGIEKGVSKPKKLVVNDETRFVERAVETRNRQENRLVWLITFLYTVTYRVGWTFRASRAGTTNDCLLIIVNLLIDKVPDVTSNYEFEELVLIYPDDDEEKILLFVKAAILKIERQRMNQWLRLDNKIIKASRRVE